MTKKDRDCSTQGNPSVVYIYRAYITLRDGTRLYAKTRGRKAFRIPVYTDKQ